MTRVRHTWSRGKFELLDRAARARPAGPLPAAAKPFLIAEILTAYVAMAARMRRADIRTVIRSCRQVSASRPKRTPAERALVASRLGGAVSQTLSILPTDSRCLIQALVLTRLLATRSIPSRFIIGTRSDPQFEAHAWVECDGAAVLPVRGFGNDRLVEL